ncbi:hypothetical protein [Sorangium sp. So ce513]
MDARLSLVAPLRRCAIAVGTFRVGDMEGANVAMDDIDGTAV